MFEAFAPSLEFDQKEFANIVGSGREGRSPQSAILSGHGLLQQGQCLHQSIIVFCLHLDSPSLTAVPQTYAYISFRPYTSTV